jgi:hypothetical protein
MPRPWSESELLLLNENVLDSENDLAQVLSRAPSEILQMRVQRGLPHGRALDQMCRQVEVNGDQDGSDRRSG